jgi:YNFM family putative membrane transporter
MTTTATATPPPLRHGDPGMRRVSLALFAAGMATFTLLYDTQPLLPLLSKTYHADPATASLSVSVTTGALALAIIPISSLSEVIGRRTVMTVSVLLAAVFGLLAPLSPSFWVLLVDRALQGAALAGVPAVAMAYLSEEVDRGSLGRAMGLYISGNSLGGFAGRFVSGALSDLGGWRLGLAGVSAFAFGCAIVLRVTLPPSVHFKRSPVQVRALAGNLRGHLADSGLVRLYIIAFLLVSSFVTMYNYLTYRLTVAPYHLSQTIMGLIFGVYLAGTVTASVAGRLSDRIGRPWVLAASIAVAMCGVLLTLSPQLAAILIGLAVWTGGFFAAHSTASSWVGSRARFALAQASALYLFAFYAGSSIGGSAGGVAYERGGWPATVIFVMVLVSIGLACALSLKSLDLRSLGLRSPRPRSSDPAAPAGSRSGRAAASGSR